MLSQLVTCVLLVGALSGTACGFPSSATDDKVYRFSVPEKLQQLEERQKYNFNKYNGYDETFNFLKKLGKTVPEFVSFEDFGVSFENRSIGVVKISDSSKSAGSKKIVLIDAGIHAREWISPATALAYIHNLVKNIDKYKKYLEKIDIYIVPILNPDGYEYTRSTDRMWRKSRSGPIDGCFGADLNRNFDFHWNGASTSTDPCDTETFDGTSPNSEVEARNLERFLHYNVDKIKAYVTLHSMAGMILYPYGYDYNVTTPDHKDLEKLGKNMSKAVEKRTGTKYDVTNSAEMYPVGGASDDYAKSIGIKYVYTMEIHGDNGFEEPEENIDIRSKEVKVALDTLLKQVYAEI